MPSYNQHSYLAAAVNSVLCHDMDLELIVADPGSVDGSREFLSDVRGRDPRVVTLFQPDTGPADALNAALLVARHGIVGCLNSDDYYLPHALDRVLGEFLKRPLATVIYAHGYIERAGRRCLSVSDTFSVMKYAYGAASVLQQSTFFSARALRDNGLRFNPMNQTCWDGELLLDVALLGGSLIRVHDVWGVFRIHPESISGSQRLRGAYHADRIRLAKKALSGSPYAWSRIGGPVGSKLAAARRRVYRRRLGRYFSDDLA